MNTPTTSEPAPLAPAAALSPLDIPSAYELVVQRLRHAIQLGTFAPGERLPPERELAARLGIARVTLREALRVLQGEGYIVTRRGAHGGPVVALPPRHVRAALRERMPQLEELIAFRCVIECGAARLAAEHATAAELKAMAGTLEEVRAAPDPAAFRRADTRFHLLLAQASRNHLLERSVENARGQMFGATDALPFTVVADRTADEHGEILIAIRRRQPEAAARRMTAHLLSALAQLRAELGLP